MSASDPASSPSREKEVFMAALDVDDPAAQAAYLDSACAGDADLRARVERLLGLEADSRSFLKPPSMMRKGMEALGEAVYPDPAEMKALITQQLVPPPVSASMANPDSPVPFIFGRRIAQGGMGAILEASDCKLGRTIAVKIMLSETGCSEEQKQRFIQEAAVLGRLEHPNIVPIHDLGRDSEGSLYYTMKRVNGRTLQDILNDLRHEKKEVLEHYTLDRLLTIFRKVCDALAFAHAQKIIHRDLKPENIMVGEFGEVLVMDWGIAKLLDHETGRPGDGETSHPAFSKSPSLQVSPSSLSATLDGAVMGTPQYMSPEQALGQVSSMDARSDIFSLGGILYAILTLRPPVEGKDVWEVIEKVSTARIAEPTTFGATTTGKGKSAVKGQVLEAKKITPLPHMPGGRVPNALSAVAMKALTLDKARRYQDITAFSADIEAFQGGFATAAEQAGLAKQLALLIKRNKGIFTTAAAAWLLITGLAVWFVFNLRAKEQRATQAEVIAVQERETARQALAKSQLDIAEKEFHLGKFVESQKILGETPESFRDANWRFLQAHSRDFTSQLPLLDGGLAYGLQFLPQGDRLAARCWVGPSKVAGVGIFSLMGHQIGDFLPQTEYYPISFGIDREGCRLAQAVTANEVAVWDLANRTVLRRWTSEIRAIERVLLSPDGETVLVAGERKLIAYAAETGAPLWTRPFIGVVPSFSPDGQTVANLEAMKGLDLQVQLLDPKTGEVRSTLEASTDNPTKTTLQFNQAGDRFACLGGDEVIMWNPRTAQKIRALHFPGETVIGMNPRGDSVATSSVSGGRIRLWATKTGRLLRSLNGIQNEVLALAFSPDGRTLVSTHRSFADGGTYVWPTRLGEEISAIVPAFLEGHSVLFNADGSRIYVATAGDVGAWDPLTGKPKWKALRTTNGQIRDLAIHPAGESILYSEMGGRTSFTHISPAGKRLEDFGTSQVSSMKFNRSGRLLLTVAHAFTDTNPGNGFSVQEYPSGKELRKITFEKPGQPFAAFCFDDAAVATAALMGGITVWDWQAGKPLRQIDAAQTGSIACLAASPDGLHLASGGPDRWIRVWEAATGRLEVAFRAHWEGVRCVKFSPDGREILSGGDDGSVRIHDAASGQERLAFYGLTTPVADVDISADGKLIAAISRDDAITKVWDRQRSSAAALLKNQPVTNQPALPKDADGWEDLLAQLTPARVAQSGNGWRMENGVLFSPVTKFAVLPLPGNLSGTSYQMRVKLRQISAQKVFRLVLPIAGQMVGFEIDGWPTKGYRTGLARVNGLETLNEPGSVHGRQVMDSELHELAVTVRLGGADAAITATLDDRPLYSWTGPVTTLTQSPNWKPSPGALALGTMAGGWAVSEVKLKRLD
ncbi:MAG: protein kinase [Verrucomicrobiaceae bacterium]|nr:protein kinase [Verrucomicrobiaceae bacterium]